MRVPKLRLRKPNIIKSYSDFLKDNPIIEGRRIAVYLEGICYYCYMNKNGDMGYYKVNERRKR